MIDTTGLSQLLLKAIRRTAEIEKFRRIIKALLPVMAGLPVLASYFNWVEFKGYGVVNIFQSVRLGLPWWLLFIPGISALAILLIFMLPRFRGRYSITAYLFVFVPILAIAGVWDVPNTLIGYTGVEVSFLLGSFYIVFALFIDYFEPSAPLENSFARFSHGGRYEHLTMLQRLANERKWEFSNPFQDYRTAIVNGKWQNRIFDIQSSREVDPPRMVLIIGVYAERFFPSLTILGGAVSTPASFRNLPILGRVRNSRGILVSIYMPEKENKIPSAYFESIKRILESQRSLLDSRSRIDVSGNSIKYQMIRSLAMDAREEQIKKILDLLSELSYLLERIPTT